MDSIRKCRACVLSRVQLFVTLWTVASQAPLSMGLPRQEYWRGLSFPSPGDFLDPGMKPGCHAFRLPWWLTELGLILGDDQLGEGNGYPLQCSFLENSMDRGVWEATVHRVTKSQTQQKWLSMHIRLIWCDEKGTSPCSVCLQNSYFQINNEKISEIAKLRDILQNVWPVFFKNVEVMKDSWEIVTDGTRLRRHDN